MSVGSGVADARDLPLELGVEGSLGTTTLFQSRDAWEVRSCLKRDCALSSAVYQDWRKLPLIESIRIYEY